jgi:Ca2+-binding EF-hand superfamily protein
MNFENADLKQRRLTKILDKIATSFFLQGFNMRRAFNLFDSNGDGEITSKEFRLGLASLNIRLRYDEIDDLMHMCDTSGDGKISYDEFITKMDLDIKRRAEQVKNVVEEAFFTQLGEAMDHSSQNLFELMEEYDFEQDGSIDTKDIIKVIKKLGIMNPEPHVPSLLKAGGCGAKDKRINYQVFSSQVEHFIAKRNKDASHTYITQLKRITAVLQSRDLSVFDFFVKIDVN